MHTKFYSENLLESNCLEVTEGKTILLGERNREVEEHPELTSFRFQLWSFLLAVFSLCVLFPDSWLALPQPWRVSFNFWTWIEPGLCN